MFKTLLKKAALPLFIFAFFSNISKAAPGDTTWVQAQNDVQLNYFGDWDTPVSFPSGAVTYRKIIMVFTLGKYACPSGDQYCGDWDYTIQNYLFTPTDTVELSRLITPYANTGAPRTPWAWKQRYYFDVTDYYTLLKNNATIRLAYHNYSGGFTGNIKFAFIEGTPPRNVTGISKLWAGAFDFGGSPSIETNIPAKNLIAPAGTAAAEMKFIVTGHGSDNSGCSEFCSKYYQVKLNGNLLEQKQLWKSDCGSNNLYPQSGTWIYNRGNWCPGEPINVFTHKLTGISAGSNYSLDVDFEPYTKSGTGSPQYIVSGYVINYGAYNRTLDASLEEIIAPSNYEGNFRANPNAGYPIVKIKNTGGTAITSLTFQYGILGQALNTQTISSLNIAPGAESLITLGEYAPLASLPTSAAYVFTATVTHANGTTDGEPLNNNMKSNFVTAPDWPASFYIRMRTNNFPTQTSWKIETLTGTTLISRSGATSPLTFYNDLVGPLPNGAYKLTVTDANCDGMYWWANSGSTGLGAIFAQNAAQTAIIPFTNGIPPVTQSGTQISVPSYSQDFGCGFTQYFRVGAVIPLDLLSFSGKADKEINHLYWETAQEKNVRNFDIEFSTNGNDFVKVAEVIAKGNTDNKSNYTTTHVPSAVAAKYYYRLKMNDIDGVFKYSSTIVLRPTSQIFAVNVVKPNPFTSTLNVEITAKANLKGNMNIFDMKGGLIHSRKVNLQKGTNKITFNNMDNLASGIYMLEVSAGEEMVLEKIVKQ